jgi:polyamine oxidase
MHKYLMGERTATYDANGEVDYMDDLKNAMDAYAEFTVAAGTWHPENFVDLSARAGYTLIGKEPKTPHEMASEYLSFDFTDGQTPEQSSFLASAWVCLRPMSWGTLITHPGCCQGSNFTYHVDQGGFSKEDLLSIDQRGIKYLIQAEAADFLKPSQVRLKSTVTTIEHPNSAVSVTLTDGTRLTAQYAICTFSLGVLQSGDVQFKPPLPQRKVEAINSMKMVIRKASYLEKRQIMTMVAHRQRTLRFSFSSLETFGSARRLVSRPWN